MNNEQDIPITTMMNTKQTTIKHSPWGPVQHETILAPGLTAVSTASHGGIHLSPEHAFIFKASFPGFKSFAGLPWLEEDCDACAAVIRWPECFSGEAVHAAVAFYMRNINGTNTIPCQKFLNQTPAGEVAKAVALKWEDDHRGQWSSAHSEREGNSFTERPGAHGPPTPAHIGKLQPSFRYEQRNEPKD